MRLHLMAALVLTGCSPSAPKDTGPSATPTRTPQVELEGAELTETVDGQKVWELDARRVAYSTSEQIAELENVTTRFYEDGKLVSRGQAPRAVLHLDDRRLRLLGGIRIETPDAASGFEADEVRWLPQPGQLQAEGDVRFWRGGHALEAARLDADRAIRRVELSGGVTGRASLTAGTNTPLFPSKLLTPSKGPS